MQIQHLISVVYRAEPNDDGTGLNGEYVAEWADGFNPAELTGAVAAELLGAVFVALDRSGIDPADFQLAFASMLQRMQSGG